MTNEFVLNARMAAFAREYVASGNAAASVRASGYSASGATAQGVRLLAKVSVQAEIARLRGLQDVEAAVDRTYVINKLRHFAENGEKESNRLRAVELLGKSVGLFTEQIEVAHTLDVSPLAEFTIEELKALRAAGSPAVEVEARVVD